MISPSNAPSTATLGGTSSSKAQGPVFSVVGVLSCVGREGLGFRGARSLGLAPKTTRAGSVIESSETTNLASQKYLEVGAELGA